MSTELNLRFSDETHFEITFDGLDSGRLTFTDPITPRDRRDLAWYLETYGAHSLGDPDDAEAARIAARLPELGEALFHAVFQGPAALRLFHRFQDEQDEARLLTVSAEHPEILSLPWELLRDPARGGVYLFQETPRISIRRRLAGATGGRAPFKVKPKDRLHLLFVVSRPEGTGFLDPRADPRAVLDAIEGHAPGRITWEFLRPATLKALVERLEDRDKPPVDILHFDGHGVFDHRGDLPRKHAEKRDLRFSRAEEIVRAPEVGIASDPDTGYLLFETEDGEADFVAAQKLGENLHQHKVSLVVLSACQSAALGEGGDEDPAERAMGSVAVRLTAAGLPSVLAMTHTVLVPTTRTLFGELYKDLARNRGVGESLDNARRLLLNNPKKYEVQRGARRVWLTLQDWFVPALYQSGSDQPLLRRSKKKEESPALPPLRSNLRPAPEAGFYGRRRELWQIESWFAGPTRRITIAGFGGQGKTALAKEAGRWLLRTRMFQTAAFVDYSRIQTVDAVAVAVSQLGTVLDLSLPDAEAARTALAATPTLVILDNLEALAEEPLRELLDAAAGWSTAGDSRVLLTTRRPKFEHPGYVVKGTRVHRRIQLAGLGSRKSPDDALEWFGELMKLPPAPTVPRPRREELIDLFEQVKFHPLSIQVLAQQAKDRSLSELGERLEHLLAQPMKAGRGDETLLELAASLQLSLDRLDPAARALLPRVGVFRGGAMENMILGITGIPEAEWGRLRLLLEAAALVESEDLPGVTVPFLRFHPTLAVILWAQVNPAEQALLERMHWQAYYRFSSSLYHEGNRDSQIAHDILRCELPNVLRAVYAALDENSLDAADFSDSVIRFLSRFGLRREGDELCSRMQLVAASLGVRSWYLAQCNLGSRLIIAGRLQEATNVFRELLGRLGEAPSYERVNALYHLGKCYADSGKPDLAEDEYRKAMAIVAEVGSLDFSWKHLLGEVLIQLGSALTDRGLYAGARESHLRGLRVKQEIGDLYGQAIAFGELGILAMAEGNLEEALGQQRRALVFFQRVQDPAREAASWHHLGIIFDLNRQWDDAERHYRESAAIRERIGDRVQIAQTWNHLAIVNLKAGRPEAAEAWFRKSIERGRETKDALGTARRLVNFAMLLLAQPGRLGEARQLAEEALAIGKTLGPGSFQIWNNYSVLSEAASRSGETQKAREYWRLAREAKLDFAGTRHELRRRAPMIFTTIAAIQNMDQREMLEKGLPTMESRGWTNLVAAIRRILDGERDADVLCDDLDLEDSMIVEAILAGIKDPSTLQDLLPPEASETSDSPS